MNFVVTRKLISSKGDYAGQHWWYNFHILPEFFDEEIVKKFVAQEKQSFSKITKEWNDDLNSEWLVRLFYSTKMVLAASLMLQNMEYAEDKNFRVCLPYLRYYSILYSIKSLIFILPTQAWGEGKLITQTHTRSINIACDVIGKLNKKMVSELKENIFYLKEVREIISYRAPSSGGSMEQFDGDIITCCKIFVELAQLESEIFEQSLHENIVKNKKYGLKDDILRDAFRSKIKDHIFWDKEDEYRIGYFKRKYPIPANILHMMSEGHVEDFFGCWCSEDQTEGDFDPDQEWRIIFDVP